MNVPFVNLTIQYNSIKKHLHPRLKEIFKTGYYIKGPFIEKFEKEYANFVGTKYCVGVASGTDALHLSLRALDIKKGDEVIIPANTFAASAYAIIYTEATPVLVDVDQKTYNMSPTLLEKAITKKTKVIMPVHLFGQPAEMTLIRKIARSYHVSILEDACQSHGAYYENRKTGSIGDIAGFSFYPGKNLGAYGDAGAITTNSQKLATRVRKLREYGGTSKYIYDEIGFNSRLDAIQGAVLLTKLEFLDEWNEKRRVLAHYYDKCIRKEFPFITIPYVLPETTSVYHVYVLQTPKRNHLMQFLENHGIQTGIHYPIPLHLQKSLEYLGYKKGDFPITEALSENGLSLPMFPELTQKQQDYVVTTMKKFFAKV